MTDQDFNDGLEQIIKISEGGRVDMTDQDFNGGIKHIINNMPIEKVAQLHDIFKKFGDAVEIRGTYWVHNSSKMLPLHEFLEIWDIDAINEPDRSIIEKRIAMWI